MASRMRKRSVWSTASFARCTESRYCTTAMPASTEIRKITTVSSMSVKPARRPVFGIITCIPPGSRPGPGVPGEDRALWALTVHRPLSTGLPLPVLVFRSVEGGAVALGEDVVHVLPAPTGRIRLVLVRPHAPFGRLGHRIDGDTSQELELAAGRVVRHRDPV